MRPRVVGLVAVSLLLAGCISAEKEDPVVPPTPQFDDSDVAAPVNVTTTADGRLYRMDVRDLDFENQLLRTTIVADEPIQVTLNAELLVSGLHHDDGCGAMGITAMNGTTVTHNLVGVAMFGENDLPIIVRAMGDEIVVHGDGSATATSYGYPFVYDLNLSLPAGARLHLDLGGRDPSFRDTDALSFDPAVDDGTRLVMEANVTGRTHLEPATPAPLRCGMGPRQLENATAGASVWLAQGAVDAAIALDTTNASSMLWAGGNFPVEPDVTLQYLDETHGFERWFIKSAPNPGHMGIEAATWVEAIPTSGWFMADVYWPALNLIEDGHP